ncbi:MAG TPA: Rossmann-like and DUF2520 domain-containing protein [Bacteroidia bacterium]|nr:Rossmann-like and DUF2520 domain-containing protein [Bacteroidia bacterium]
MKIVIIGTGNVATQLGIAFREAKHEIMQVYGRNKAHAKTLAKKLNTAFISDLKKINLQADIYLVAVSDSSIEAILKGLKLTKQLVAHTSGSISMNVFKKRFLNHGVFYPVQTISKNMPVDFKTTVICIEANNGPSQIKLHRLAQSISKETRLINSAQRRWLHLAAVFVNNFTNHLFHIGDDILTKNGLWPELLMPLINQTVNNLKDKTPSEVQTGPAVRRDKNTIDRHLKMLEKYPAYKKIYKDITQSIQQSGK